MTLLVRDAADILDANIRYHHAQGVDLFIVADNGSTDGSLDILQRYEREGIVRLERIEGSRREVWAAGRTRIARLAHELGADWVIHNDQDEFWWSLTGDVKETLAAIPDRYGLVVAPRTEFVARPGDDHFPERLIYREARFLHPPKAAHRTHPRIVLDHPHPTRIEVEKDDPSDPFSGRPGLSGGAASHSEQPDFDLVFAPTYPLRVLHFPIRGFTQYRERIELASKVGLLDSKDRQGIRAALEEGRLDELYADVALTDDDIRRGIDEGWLVEDTDFRDYLAACPESLDGPPPPGSRAWSEERRRRELEELEFDAMYAITRYVRRRGTRERQAADKVRRQEQRARRQPREDESGARWRPRARLPRPVRRLTGALRRRSNGRS